MPFGDELCAGTGGRTTGMGFCAGGDTNRKKFTGYEFDTETGLDFAQARYFRNGQGRFTSPDNFGGRITNPQTLNLYAYVMNNPLKLIDPTGHQDKKADDKQQPPPKKSKPATKDGDDFVVENPCSTPGCGSTIVIAVVKVYPTPETIQTSGAPTLASSFHDYVPAWGSTRKALFYMHTQQFEWSLFHFGKAAVEGTPLGLAGISWKAASEGASLTLLSESMAAESGVITGLYGTATVEGLEALASGGGTSVEVATNLTSAPVKPDVVCRHCRSGSDKDKQGDNIKPARFH